MVEQPVMVVTRRTPTRTGEQLVSISLPLVPFLLDEHPGKYAIADHPAPPQGQEPAPDKPHGGASRRR